jgi:hypothetical protein
MVSSYMESTLYCGCNYCEGLNGHPPYSMVMIELFWISLALSANFITFQLAHTILPFKNLVFGCVSHTRKCAGSSTNGLRQYLFGPLVLAPTCIHGQYLKIGA